MNIKKLLAVLFMLCTLACTDNERAKDFDWKKIEGKKIIKAFADEEGTVFLITEDHKIFALHAYNVNVITLYTK